jgi:hypothetical protein
MRSSKLAPYEPKIDMWAARVGDQQKEKAGAGSSRCANMVIYELKYSKK